MSLASQLILGFAAVGAEVKKRAITAVLTATGSSSGLSNGTVILRTGFPQSARINPPTGGTWYAEPDGVLSAGGGLPTKGILRMVPILIGPKGWTTSAFVVNISTAFAGGAGCGLNVGLYGSDASGMPDWTAGPLAQNLLALNGAVTTGIKTTAWSGGNYALKPGLYWIVVLYVWTTIPTAGAITCYNNTSYRLASPTSLAPGTSVRSLVSSSSTNTSLPSAAPAYAVSAATDMPAIGIVAA